MSGSLLGPNMDSDFQLKRSYFDVTNEKKGGKKAGMKHQKDPKIKLQTNLAG